MFLSSHCRETLMTVPYIFSFVLSAHDPERRGRNLIHRAATLSLYTPAGVHWQATRKNGLRVEQPACSIRGSTRSSTSRRRRSAKRRQSAPAAADSRESGWRWESPARRREAYCPGTGRRGSPDPAHRRTVPSSKTPEIATANARKRLPDRNDPLQGGRNDSN